MKPSKRIGKVYKGYQIKKYIGSGAYGQVFLATKKIKGKLEKFALKLFDFNSSQTKKDYQNEVEAYRKISESPECFEYIVCMYNNFEIPERKLGVIVLEFMAGGNLFEYIKKYRDGVNPSKFILIMKDLLEGLAFIHENDMAHSDIKPANILVSSDDSSYKMADLGGVCKNPPPPPEKCKNRGTASYRPPELARIPVFRPISLKAAQKGDIWAMGLVFWELAFGLGVAPIDNRWEIPGGKRSDQEISESIAKVTSQDQIRRPNYPATSGNVSSRAINTILYYMTAYDPDNRPSASRLLEYLVSEMRGCTLNNKKYTREELQTLMKPNTELGRFLSGRKQGYGDLIPLGKLCDWLADFFVTVEPKEPKSEKRKSKEKAKVSRKKRKLPEPEVSPVKVEPPKSVKMELEKLSPAKPVTQREPEPVTDKEIYNKAIRECRLPGKVYTCEPRALQAVSRLVLQKGEFPRSVESYESLVWFFKGKSGEQRIIKCLLCLFLAYRELTIQRGFPDPGLPREFPRFKCIIEERSISLKQLKEIAKKLEIPSEGTEKSLCSEIYSTLLLHQKIKRGSVARDIYKGIILAAKTDISAGLPALSKMSTSVSRAQTDLISNILNVALLGDYQGIDVDFLRRKEIELRRDLELLKRYPQSPQIQQRRLLTLRTLGFLNTVVKTIFRK